jgi:hypothetical protein
VFEAVAQCRAKGAADADITVDVIYTTASSLPVVDASTLKTPAVQARGQAITAFTTATREVLYAKRAYPGVNFRYVVSPSTSLAVDPTDYSAAARATLLGRGLEDAKNAILAAQPGAAECNPATQAPASCAQDQDCVDWAARACRSAELPIAGRCLVESLASSAGGRCSFNATEVADFRADRTKKLATEATTKCTCLAVTFSGGGDRGAFQAGVLKGLAAAAPESIQCVVVVVVVVVALLRYVLYVCLSWLTVMRMMMTIAVLFIHSFIQAEKSIKTSQLMMWDG